MKLKIGIITPFSNEFPFLSSDFVDGLKFSFSEMADVTFIHVETERGVAKEATPLFRQLIVKERVNLIVAFLDVLVIQSVKELITTTQTPVILSGMGVRLPIMASDSSPFIFYNTFRMWESCWLSGQIAAKLYGKKVGVFASFFDSGYPLIYAHSKGAQNIGSEPLYYNITHKEDTELELQKSIEKASQNEVDYFFASYYGKERKFIFDWFQNIGIDANRVIATSSIAPNNEKIANVTSWHYNINTEENRQFIDNFEANVSNKANEFSLLGYESGLFICEALKGAVGIFNATQFVDSLKNVVIMSPRGEMAMHNQSQSSYGNHYHVWFNSITNQQQMATIEYPQEEIQKELQLNEPCNILGWQNTYLCK